MLSLFSIYSIEIMSDRHNILNLNGGLSAYRLKSIIFLKELKIRCIDK